MFRIRIKGEELKVLDLGLGVKGLGDKESGFSVNVLGLRY